MRTSSEDGENYDQAQSEIELPSNLWYQTRQIPTLNVSRLALQLSLSNPLKPGIK